MPRPVEAIPAVGRGAVRHPPPRAGAGFKRPASGQVLQTFDAGDLVVEHWPDGRPRAVGLAWAAGVLAAGLVVAALFFLMVRRGVRAHGDWDLLILVLVCWVGMIATMAGMSRRAWRDLVLRAGPTGLRVVVGGRERRWPAGRVGAIQVYETGRADVRWPLGELQIDVGDPAGPLRLLADRDAEQLEMLARLIRTALGNAAAEGPAEDVAPSGTGVPSTTLGPAEEAAPTSSFVVRALARIVPSTGKYGLKPALQAKNAPSATSGSSPAKRDIPDPTPTASNDDAGPAQSHAEPREPQSAPLPVAPAAIDRLVGVHRSLWNDGRLKPGGAGAGDQNEVPSEDDQDDEPPRTLDYGQEPKRSLRRILPLSGPVPVEPLGMADVDSAIPLATAHRAPLAALAPSDAPDSAHAHASILDYAGPRPRGKDGLANTRLPAVSDLRVDFEPDGGVTITETLAGKEMAIIAIAFAAVILVLVACTAIIQVKEQKPPDYVGASVLAVVFVVELVVLIMVISNTWRRTVVQAGPAGLRLDFHVLLRRPKRHHWPADRVRKMGIVPQPGPRGLSEAASPAELRIEITDGPRLHLFTGHPKAELWPLAQHIERGLGGERGRQDDKVTR